MLRQQSAGATFNEDSPNLTINVHKTCLETIFKIKASLYGITDIYNEFNTNPPFSGWKPGLAEVWN